MKNIVDEIDIWLGKYREIYLRKRAKPIEELRQIAEEWQSNSATAIGWADELAKEKQDIISGLALAVVDIKDVQKSIGDSSDFGQDRIIRWNKIIAKLSK